jgi:peptidoglycan/LPS O-acetylase OafA/YrhL
MTAGLWYVVAFSLVVGAAMPVFWVTAIAAGKVPEIEEGSREIWFHIAAETATGLTLIGGAIATLVAPSAKGSAVATLLGMGLLGYSLTVSPGYYADRREWPMVAMFGCIWAAAIPAVVLRIVA